jgi:pimeloyl-ACP methyl ester carboxylesterase
MPLPFLLNRLAGLISLAILLTGVWFVADWVDRDLRSDAWLYAGSVLVALSLFGRVPVNLLFRKADGPRPGDLPTGEIDTVTGAGGARLHVECFGPRDGRPVVLTHGWGMDRSVWSGMVRTLSKRHRVIVWDLPGLGRSGRPYDGCYSLERFAEDLRHVMIAAVDRPALLVGHSIGGMTILSLCRHRPEMFGREVAGVALLDSTGRTPGLAASGPPWLGLIESGMARPLLRLSVWLSPLFHLGAWASYLNGTAQLVARATGFGDDPPREAVDHVALLQARHAPSVQAKGALAMLRWDAPQVPETLPVPALVVSGGRDLLTPPEAGRAVAAAAPLGEFMLVEEAGHAGFLELPEVYERAVLRHAEAVFARADRTSRPLHADVLRRREQILGAPPPAEPSAEPFAEPRSFARPDGGEAHARH